MAGFDFATFSSKTKRIAEKLKLVLEETIRAAEEKKSATEKDLSRITVDSTVREKNTPKKIYSFHEIGVPCIGKGKERIRCEFGSKSPAVTRNNRNRIVNVEDSADNPCDGHALNVSITGVGKITKVSVTEADAARGSHGHDYKGTAVVRIAGSGNRGLSNAQRKRKKRRSAIEPIIGRMKADHRSDRRFLKGRAGDALNLTGSAAGFNVRKLLRLPGRGIFSHAPTHWGLLASMEMLRRRFFAWASRLLPAISPARTDDPSPAVVSSDFFRLD